MLSLVHRLLCDVTNRIRSLRQPCREMTQPGSLRCRNHRPGLQATPAICCALQHCTIAASTTLLDVTVKVAMQSQLRPTLHAPEARHRNSITRLSGNPNLPGFSRHCKSKHMISSSPKSPKLSRKLHFCDSRQYVSIPRPSTKECARHLCVERSMRRTVPRHIGRNCFHEAIRL